jgi:hypothetical protein
MGSCEPDRSPRQQIAEKVDIAQNSSLLPGGTDLAVPWAEDSASCPTKKWLEFDGNAVIILNGVK